VIYVLYEDSTGRAILDCGPHQKVLATIKAGTWLQARYEAIRLAAMDPYFYRPGHGWFKRTKT